MSVSKFNEYPYVITPVSGQLAKDINKLIDKVKQQEQQIAKMLKGNTK